MLTPNNPNLPLIMHIDLNSCFAIIEQQANRLLRGRPVAVAAYDTPRGMIIASSYEAKRLGIKLGVTVGEARVICPDIAVMTPDPAKYREAHKRFKEVLLQYTSDVTPKSIDEFVVNFAGSPAHRQFLKSKTPDQQAKPHLRWIRELGLQIKQKIHDSLGEAVTVNIGIGPNRFLAKLAAGLNKPNGMDVIYAGNLEQTLTKLDLLDLPGINVRYKRRLQMWGIDTPLQFWQAESSTLQKIVFESIVGHHWYLRLRGYEVDDRPTVERTIGHQYALSVPTYDRIELEKLLLKLSEKTGRRLRKKQYYAAGIHLHLRTQSYGSWHQGHKLDTRLYSTTSIYGAVKELLSKAIINDKVTQISMTVYELHPWNPEQLSIFANDRQISATKRVSDALDIANNRYGEYVVISASMMGMKSTILDRVAFGSVRDL
jgi:DNA polymerase IV